MKGKQTMVTLKSVNGKHTVKIGGKDVSFDSLHKALSFIFQEKGWTR